MNRPEEILIIYGSLNSVPSPEGAAPAKVIQETLAILDDDRFKVLSNTNTKLKGWDYNQNVFYHVKYSFLTKLALLFLKLRFNYAARKKRFITGSDAQLHYFIAVCLFVRKHQFKKLIVHVSPGLVSMLKLFCPQVQIIFYHHGTSLHTKLNTFQWIQLLKQTIAVFGVNEAAKIKANETFENKIESNYFSIHNGVKSMKLNDIPKAKTFTVLFSGRVCKEKGVLHLIKAIKILQDKNVSVKLIIAGGGGTKRGLQEANKYIASCKKYIEKYNLNVSFTGYLQKEELEKLYNQVHVLVLPTDPIYSSEGLSLSLIEGLSVGLPVIASKVGGNAEVVEDKRNGFLIKSQDFREKEIADYIEFLISNPEQYKKFSDRSRKTYNDKFTPELMRRQFIKALKTLDFVS